MNIWAVKEGNYQFQFSTFKSWSCRHQRRWTCFETLSPAARCAPIKAADSTHRVLGFLFLNLFFFLSVRLDLFLIHCKANAFDARSHLCHQLLVIRSWANYRAEGAKLNVLRLKPELLNYSASRWKTVFAHGLSPWLFASFFFLLLFFFPSQSFSLSLTVKTCTLITAQNRHTRFQARR